MFCSNNIFEEMSPQKLYSRLIDYDECQTKMLQDAKILENISC